MRNLSLAVMFVVLLSLLFAGCSITIGSGGGGPADRGIYRGDDAATLAEIDAVSSLNFDDSKKKGYKNIASRPHLSAPAQIYLVQTSLATLNFEESKKDVIMALIKNPYFLGEGKKKILENLGAFHFNSTKEDILEALNRRGHVPYGSETEIIIEPQEPEPTIIITPSLEMEAGSITEM